MRGYKSGVRKFFEGLLITILVLGALVGVGFILDSTIPAVHEFFISVGDWVKNLFSSNKEAVAEPSYISLFIARK